MKIALINENSQAEKNAQIYEILKEEAEKVGHTVDNYGMYTADDETQADLRQERPAGKHPAVERRG